MNENEPLKILQGAMPPRFVDLQPDAKYYPQVKKGTSLLITGNVGTGKTRLLLEILLAEKLDNFQIIKTTNFDEVYFEKDPAKYRPQVMRDFCSVADVLRKIKEGFDHPTERNIVNDMINKPILYLDDLGTEKASDWVKEQLYLVINERYNWVRPVVITTNLNMQEIAEAYGERFASRLVEMCDVIKLTGDDRRTLK